MDKTNVSESLGSVGTVCIRRDKQLIRQRIQCCREVIFSALLFKICWPLASIIDNQSYLKLS